MESLLIKSKIEMQRHQYVFLQAFVNCIIIKIKILFVYLFIIN